MTRNTLIIGYGNPLRGDDGVGQAVARAFEAEAAIEGAEVVSCRQLTPELAESFAARIWSSSSMPRPVASPAASV